MEKIDILLWVISGGFGIMLVMWHFMNSRMDRLDYKIESLVGKQDFKIEEIKKDLQNIGTRIAVMESKISDISANVAHLMWHHQAIPRDSEEQQ